MGKEKISNIAGVVIIFRGKNPSEIFIEVKDDGYPMKIFRRCLCPIGGNWIGEKAKLDKNPLDTVRREVNEELTLEGGLASTLELKLLGIEPEGNFYRTSRKDFIPSNVELEMLIDLKQTIIENCTPFGDFRCKMPREVLLKGDPNTKQEGHISLISYWTVALRETEWNQLVDLQKKFGNLSNESVTIITSLQEIINTGTKTAFGHDWALQKFFLSFGLEEAYLLPFIEGNQAEEAGKTLASYGEYLDRYDIQRKPQI